MSKSIEDDFIEKYPVSGYAWQTAATNYCCEQCDSDIYQSEVALFGDKVCCSTCGIAMYENLRYTQAQQTVRDTKPVIIEEAKPTTQQYTPPDWIQMRDGSCYFCGHGNCSHKRY